MQLLPATIRRRSALVALLMLAALISLIPSTVAAQGNDNESNGVLVAVSNDAVLIEGQRSSTVVVVDGNVVIEGTVETVIVAVDANIEIRSGAQIEGDIFAFDSDINLRDGSVTTADVHIDENSRLIVETGAEFTGDTSRDMLNFNSDFLYAAALIFLAIAFGWMIFSIISALIFAGVGGEQLRSSAVLLSRSPLAVILAAIITIIVISILSSGVWFTLLIFPLVGSAIALTQILILLGTIVVGTRLGAMILDRDLSAPDAGKPYAPAVLGTFILQLIAIIALSGGTFLVLAAFTSADLRLVGPIVGIPAAIFGLILLLVALYGIGALALRAYHAWRAP